MNQILSILPPVSLSTKSKAPLKSAIGLGLIAVAFATAANPSNLKPIIQSNTANTRPSSQNSFEKISTIHREGVPAWLSAEASQWWREHGLAPLDRFNQLDLIILQIFGSVRVCAEVYYDPDEDWAKLGIDIFSNFGNDFKSQFAKKKQLWLEIKNSAALKEISKYLIIEQS